MPSIVELSRTVLRRVVQRAIGVAFAAVPAVAQNQQWVRQLGTTGGDSANAAAQDGSGGVFIGGSTLGNLGGQNAGAEDAWLARYDSAGNQLWITQLGSGENDYIHSSAQDGSGGVYVCGSTDGSLGGPNAGHADAWLARYDGAGTRVWLRQLGSNSSDHAYAAASDGSGGVYVSGDTHGSLGGMNVGLNDAWLARYDGAGNQSWILQLGTSDFDYGYAAAPDGSGGVHVGGSTTGALGGPSGGPGSPDAWLAHFDSAGTQLWIRQLGTAANDEVHAATTDGMGGVYACGWTGGSLGGPYVGLSDAWLARYDHAGNRVWVRQLGTAGFEDASAIAADGAGGLYVTGWTNDDAWLARYDNMGNQLWFKKFGTGSQDSANCAASDLAGGVFVGGSTFGSLGGQNAGGFDAWLGRYEGACGVSSTYCTASTTSLPGCKAAIGATGSLSFANPAGFTISSGKVPGGNLGICLFGDSGAASTPLGTLGGLLCVQAPVHFSAPKPSGGTKGICNGTYTFTLQDLINASPIVTSGATIHAQVWARDPANQDEPKDTLTPGESSPLMVNFSRLSATGLRVRALTAPLPFRSAWRFRRSSSCANCPRTFGCMVSAATSPSRSDFSLLQALQALTIKFHCLPKSTSGTNSLPITCSFVRFCVGPNSTPQ